jgi:hypothetical protein
MPSTETLERYVLRVEKNDHAGAAEEFYMPDASIQENQSAPRIGRHTQVERERVLMTKVRTLTSQCVRPIFVSGERVVIRWQFRFDWLDDTVTEMEEVACQRWEGERIAEEIFFYDPAQRVPKKLTKTIPDA